MNRSAPAGTYVANKMELHSIDPGDISGTNEKAGFAGQAGRYIDIKPIVHAFSIKESVTSGYLSGEAKVYDSTSLFYELPLRGQELLHLELEDFRGEIFSGDFFIYSVDQVKPAKKSTDSILEYVIKFVSIGKFISERYMIRRCIADGSGASRQYKPISEQVQVLYDDYYKFDRAGGINTVAPEKNIRISETDGDQKIVIPYLSPDDAMHLFSRRAHSETYPSDMFRFFETREQYHFSNLEELMDAGEEAIVETYTYTSGGPDTSPEAELQKMTNVLDVSFGEVVNTFRVMKEGGYSRSYTAVDINYRFPSTFTYDHYDEMIVQKNFKYTDMVNPFGDKIRFNHTPTFIARHLDDRKRIFGIKDYPDDGMSAPVERPPTNYGEIVNHKRANLAQFDEYGISISIYGNHKLYPGKMIYLDVPEFKSDTSALSREDRKDSSRSGVYMITDIENVYYENEYKQNISLIKSGLSDNPNTRDR
jgi:hypothetical protein